MRTLLVTVVLSMLIVGCQKPTHEECDEICWTYNELNYWERFEKDTADLSAEEKAEVKAARQKTWDEMKNRKFDPGLENCVTGCREGGKKSMVACMRKAKTAADARTCMK